MAMHNMRRFAPLAAFAIAAAMCIYLTAPAWAQDEGSGGARIRPAVKRVEEDKSGGEGEGQKEGEQEQKDKDKGNDGGGWNIFGNMTPFVIIIGVFLLMYIFMGSSRRKREAKRREMLGNVKKGDKVTSIGGICGTVADVREDEIILKVDDNTRMRLARWALKGIGEDAKAERPEGKK